MSDVMDERIATIMDLVDAYATDARTGGASDKYRERIRDALKLWTLVGEVVGGAGGDAILTKYLTNMDRSTQELLLIQIEDLMVDPDESLTFRRTEEGGLQITWRREPHSGDRDRVRAQNSLQMTGRDPENTRHSLRYHALTYGRYNGGPAAGLALDLGRMQKQLVDADLMGDDS